MTVAVPYLSFPGLRAAARRFALALAASAVAHLFLIQSLIVDVRLRAARPVGAGTITVHLEPQAGAQAASPDAPVPEPPLVARPVGPRVAAGAGGRHAAPAGTGARPKPDAGVPLALPQALDPTYYSARDLDVYPRPAAPLDFGRFARGDSGGAAGGFRLALLIDEGGIVNEITVVAAGPAGRLLEELRAALAATRFIPGQKDGRAVKSRVVLSVSFESAGGNKMQP